jgi:hypothetical protein
MADDNNLVVSVIFNRKSAPYNAGEKAGFDKKQAQRLIDHKIARLAHPVTQRVAVTKQANQGEASSPVPPAGDKVDTETNEDVGNSDADNSGNVTGAHSENRQEDKPKRRRGRPRKNK